LQVGIAAQRRALASVKLRLRHDRPSDRRSKSTISRELCRNRLPSGRYSPLHVAGAYQLRRRRERQRFAFASQLALMPTLTYVLAILCGCRRQARRPPLVKIRPGSPAPTNGPGTTCARYTHRSFAGSSCPLTNLHREPGRQLHLGRARAWHLLCQRLRECHFLDNRCRAQPLRPDEGGAIDRHCRSTTASATIFE
jgi:hypothetical protein